MSKKTFQAAKEKTLIVQLKNNQKILKRRSYIVLKDEDPVDYYKQTEQYTRGRIENRMISVYDNQQVCKYIWDEQWKQYIQSLIVVIRETTRFNTKRKLFPKPTIEVAYYISNQPLKAKDAAQHIRKHWAIENRNNHVRDVTLFEDDSRIRVNPENMATIRSFALNVMRKNKTSNIREQCYANSLDYSRLYDYQHFI